MIYDLLWPEIRNKTNNLFPKNDSCIFIVLLVPIFLDNEMVTTIFVENKKYFINYTTIRVSYNIPIQIKSQNGMNVTESEVFLILCPQKNQKKLI